MGNVTLKDIAQILGISITTTSKALKDYPDVKKETREAVRLLAQKLNYKPNPLALNLRNKESKTIGIIIPQIDHNFFSSVINGIIQEAERQGYLVITLLSNESSTLEKKQIELLIEKRVDGVLMALSNETDHHEHLKLLGKMQIPLVLFDKTTDAISCSTVSIDDKAAAFSAVDYLIRSGCNQIVHLRGPEKVESYTNRFLGYEKALMTNSISIDKKMTYVCNLLTFEDGYHQTKQALKDHPKTDAIFAMTDLVALGSLAYCKEQGIDVPGKISIMGFSNWFMSGHSNPKLSTVQQPIEELGKEAVEILLQEIREKKDEKPLSQTQVMLPTNLILRETTK